MAIKIESEILERKDYPCLKTNGAFVVLFIKKYTGTIVGPKGFENRIGEYSEVWAEHNFYSYEGSITISNIDKE